MNNSQSQIKRKSEPDPSAVSPSQLVLWDRRVDSRIGRTAGAAHACDRFKKRKSPRDPDPLQDGEML